MLICSRGASHKEPNSTSILINVSRYASNGFPRRTPSFPVLRAGIYLRFRLPNHGLLVFYFKITFSVVNRYDLASLLFPPYSAFALFTGRNSLHAVLWHYLTVRFRLWTSYACIKRRDFSRIWWHISRICDTVECIESCARRQTSTHFDRHRTASGRFHHHGWLRSGRCRHISQHSDDSISVFGIFWK